MKYESGQKVQILHDLQEGRGIYGSTFCASPMVEDWAGKIVTLENKASNQVWNIEEDTGYWDWNEAMFTPVVTNPDEAFEMYLAGKMSEKEYTALMRKGART